MLKAKGVPARLVLYPDENHWVLGAQNSIHWYGEFDAWLARWIGKGGR
jgi:dipeptidyl aminopeptidase/acylaminoacyl peptidase